MADERDVLEALRRLASGQEASDGRDVVPGDKLVVGAAKGRCLTLAAEGDLDRLTLRLEGGAIVLGFARRGEFIFEYGDLILEGDDGSCELVAAVASWLGVIFTGEGSGRSAVRGQYARLGVRRDADGRDWDMFKVFLDAGELCGEIFLRVRADRAEAALVEKWSEYRVPLALLLDAAVGEGRSAEPHIGLAIAGTQIQLSLPPDWIVSDGKGCVRMTDPSDECALEISYFHLPSLADAPPVGGQLREILEGREASIVTSSRLGIERAWADYPFDCDDPNRGGARRPARGRWLIASNGTIQALATFSYWVDDASWAVPAWERIVSTLRLGDGAGLSGFGSGPLSWSVGSSDDLVPDVAR